MEVDVEKKGETGIDKTGKEREAGESPLASRFLRRIFVVFAFTMVKPTLQKLSNAVYYAQGSAASGTEAAGGSKAPGLVLISAWMGVRCALSVYPSALLTAPCTGSAPSHPKIHGPLRLSRPFSPSIAPTFIAPSLVLTPHHKVPDCLHPPPSLLPSRLLLLRKRRQIPFSRRRSASRPHHCRRFVKKRRPRTCLLERRVHELDGAERTSTAFFSHLDILRRRENTPPSRNYRLLWHTRPRRRLRLVSVTVRSAQPHAASFHSRGEESLSALRREGFLHRCVQRAEAVRRVRFLPPALFFRTRST